MSPKLKNFITTVFLCLIGIRMYGQDGPPPPATRSPVPVGLPPLPIDDHIVALAFLGAIVGIFYYLKRRPESLS